jgi:crotonobetainyl-CoA:carnitine CoA-transferase CaiB-like acyl-CoA transferase
MRDVQAILDDIIVVEIGVSIATAFAGKAFADLGASVYAERPIDRFDGSFSATDEHLGLYLDNRKRPPSGITPVDVVLVAQGAAPDNSSVAVDDTTVVVDVSTFDAAGTLAGATGTELTIQARSGLASLYGDANREPLAMAGHQIAYSTGLAAFTGAMIALHARETTRRGQRVAVSEFDTAAYIEWKGRQYHQGGRTLVRGERSGPVVVQCSDGPFGLFYSSRDWPAVVDVLGDPTLADPPFDTHDGRTADLREFATRINRFSSRLTRTELLDRLQERNVPVAPVLNAAELMEARQNQFREYITRVPGSSARQPSFPSIFHIGDPAESATK